MWLIVIFGEKPGRGGEFCPSILDRVKSNHN